LYGTVISIPLLEDLLDRAVSQIPAAAPSSQLTIGAIQPFEMAAYYHSPSEHSA
jgi:hypothetical protein